MWRRRLLPLGLVGLVTALWCLLFLPLFHGFGTAPGESRGRSLVELLTAHRLASHATRHAEQGDWKEAVRLARLAVLQRPNSPDANRILLVCLRQDAGKHAALDPQEVHHAVTRLLASSSDAADVNLAMSAAMDVGDYQPVMDRLLPEVGTLSIELQGLLLEALVSANQLFDQPRPGAVRQVLARPDLDESLRGYRTALAAAEVGSPGAEAAWTALVQAGVAGPSYSRVASRLLLQVATARQDIGRAREALFRLSSHGDDLLWDHLGYWGILVREQRADEVRLLVQNRVRPARTTGELVAGLQLMGDLGLHGEAVALLREGSAAGIEDGRGILACLQALCRSGRWKDLRMIEPCLTRDGVNRTTASLLEHLVLALVAQNEGRLDDADFSFRRLLEESNARPQMAQDIASALLAIQEPARAELLAQRVEWDLRGSASYWALRQEIAFRTRNPTALVLASRRALEVAPQDPSAQANLAWSEIIERGKPRQPLSAILRQLALHPLGPRRELGQALAAAWYGEGAALQAALARLSLEELDPPDRELARFARCETLVTAARMQEALDLAITLQEASLFPAQRSWLSLTLGTLRGDGTVAGSALSSAAARP